LAIASGTSIQDPDNRPHKLRYGGCRDGSVDRLLSDADRRTTRRIVDHFIASLPPINGESRYLQTAALDHAQYFIKRRRGRHGKSLPDELG